MLYAAAAGALFAPTLGALTHSIPGSADGAQVIWWMRWLTHSLALGHSPFVTKAIGYPYGANELWNPSALLVALILSPVTVLAGPVVAANLAFISGPVVSGIVAALVVRRYTRAATPAVLAGLLYGFSPYMRGGMLGHEYLLWAAFPPLLFLLLDELLARERRSPYMLGCWLGLLGAAQLLVSTEVLALGVLVAAVGVLACALLHPHRIRAGVGRAARALLTAVPVAALFAGYPLSVALAGPLRITGPIQTPGRYVADLTGTFVPSALQAISPPSSLAISRHFEGGNGADAVSYLGIPLIAVLVFAAIRWWRVQLVRFLAIMLVVTEVLALGPWLTVAGHRHPGIPLPWDLIGQLALLRSALPVRMALSAIFFAALLFAIALDRALGAPGRRRRWLGAAVLGLALVPLWPWAPVRPTPLPPTPAFFTDPGILHRLPAGAPVLIAPFPHALHDTAMVWQAAAGIRFSLVGAYQMLPDAHGHRLFGPPAGPVGAALIRIESGAGFRPTEAWRAAATAQLRGLRLAAIVVGPMRNEAAAIALIGTLLHQVPAVVGGVSVWWAPI